MESQLLTIKHLWPLDTYYSITEFLLPTEWVNARSVSLKMIATDKRFFFYKWLNNCCSSPATACCLCDSGSCPEHA